MNIPKNKIETKIRKTNTPLKLMEILSQKIDVFKNSAIFNDLNSEEIKNVLQEKWQLFKIMDQNKRDWLVSANFSESKLGQTDYQNKENRNLKPKNYLYPDENIQPELIFKPEEKYKVYENVELNFDLEPVVLNALKELNEAGKGVNIVGGAVRDMLQGREPKDIDFEVYGLDKNQIIEILKKYGEVRIQGASFGVIVLKTESAEYEFAIPRKDNKTGVGYKGFEVELNPDFTVKEASRRRDFTWNSMSYDPIQKILYDPNNGLNDLENGILKHVDDKTFAEDPLRILRALQFSGRMGLQIAPETAISMQQIIKNGELNALSKDRIAGEWIKWATKSDYPTLIFEFLRKSGLEEIYPDFKDLKNTEQDVKYHPEGNVEEHTMQVLAKAVEISKRENLDQTNRIILVFSALLHDIAKPQTTEEIWSDKENRFKISARGHEAAGVEPATKFLQKIGISKKIVEIIQPLIREHLAHATITSIDNEKGQKSAFSKLVDRLKPASTDMLILLMEADMMGRNNANKRTPETILKFKDLWENYKKENGGEKFKPLITGKDLKKLGIEPGPEMGKILKMLKEKQQNSDFEDRESALVWVQQNIHNLF